jgi:hypothetical protein
MPCLCKCLGMTVGCSWFIARSQEFQRRAKARGINDIEFLACQPGFVASPLYDKSVGGTIYTWFGLSLLHGCTASSSALSHLS